VIPNVHHQRRHRARCDTSTPNTSSTGFDSTTQAAQHPPTIANRRVGFDGAFKRLNRISHRRRDRRVATADLSTTSALGALLKRWIADSSPAISLYRSHRCVSVHRATESTPTERVSLRGWQLPSDHRVERRSLAQQWHLRVLGHGLGILHLIEGQYVLHDRLRQSVHLQIF
jgi:hypothetical protein